jgi:hypothetical protein
MSDYRGEVDPDLRTEMFTEEALRVLAEEVCVQSHLLVMSFIHTIESTASTEVAMEIAAKQFIGSAGLTSERLGKALGLGTDLADIATALELHPAFRPRTYVDFGVDLDEGANELTLHLGSCPALKESGLDSWISILADGHAKALLAAVQGINPAAVVAPVETQPGDMLTWRVEITDEAAEVQSEVSLARFSTGADVTFSATPVELSRRDGSGDRAR